MQLPPLIPATFIDRPNRYLATVMLEGQPCQAHVPDPGRLRELLIPGCTVWLAEAGHPGRKTHYDLVLVQHGEQLVSLDTRLPNAIFAEAIGRGQGMPRPVVSVRREVRRGDSRLDLQCVDTEGVHWVEIKSVTLVQDGLALFPDAPTVRGRRHVLELMDAVRAGEQASVVFVIQRSDATRFAPHRVMDPDLADALIAAHEAGVQVRAYTCRVTLQSIELLDQVPVLLDA